MRLLIHVQHLLGIGHLQRALQLAAGLAQAGLAVDLVSGGMPVALPPTPGVKLHQLPPLRSADGRFDRLLDDTGNAIDDAWRERRRRRLLDIFARVAPDALITETFPFGRRMLRFELLPLLEAAQQSDRCRLVIASIRDILQPKQKRGRNAEIVDLVRAYYDHVIVHGDAAIAPLAQSFPRADEIAEKVSYSGYICRPASDLAVAASAADEVLVSAGGSATGLRLLQTALAARPLSCLRDKTWRLRVSPGIEAKDFSSLREAAGDGIIVERNQDDFHARVARAVLSVSQAGYNTVTDILASSTPAVLVPYAEADEVEQTMRAALLQQHRRVVSLEEAALSSQSLALAIDTALQQSTRLEVNLDGLDNSVHLLRGWLDALDKSA